MQHFYYDGSLEDNLRSNTNVYRQAVCIFIQEIRIVQLRKLLKVLTEMKIYTEELLS